MKNSNNYNEYINEVWKMKEKAYNDYLASKHESFVSFIKEELSGLKIKYHKKKILKK